MYKAYVFDVDGTLLDTIADLTAVTNALMREHGFPEHTRETLLGFVGGGPGRLLKLACPAGTPDAVLAQLGERWQAELLLHDADFCQPFHGVTETLRALRAGGARLGVVSNKPDRATKHVIEHFFPGIFHAVHGADEANGWPRKPNPAGLLRCLDELGAAPNEAVYVGDAPTDVQVAKAAGCLAVGASWGYNAPAALAAEEPDQLISRMAELLK